MHTNVRLAWRRRAAAPALARRQPVAQLARPPATATLSPARRSAVPMCRRLPDYCTVRRARLHVFVEGKRQDSPARLARRSRRHMHGTYSTRHAANPVRDGIASDSERCCSRTVQHSEYCCTPGWRPRPTVPRYLPPSVPRAADIRWPSRTSRAK
jgi:hypothetical protein